jgi:stage V sporulation protein D (sporulation-specific penicillin-binding protein)
MGQEIAVTPLQMVTAYTAMLNGGVLLRPQIVAEITNRRGEELYRMRPQPVRRVVTTRTSRAMRSILHRTVVSGTGRRAFCREYAIGGKTGTAQKVVNGRYSHEKYVGSFCGFAPAENPKLVCLVTVDEPRKSLGYYGGTVAAPAVRTILRRGLNALGVPTRDPREQDAAERAFKRRGG